MMDKHQNDKHLKQNLPANDKQAERDSTNILQLQSMKEKLCCFCAKSISAQGMYVISAMIGLLCAVSAYHSYKDSHQDTYATKLVNTLEKHGYSGHRDHHIHKFTYGSLDLLTTEMKQEFVKKLTLKLLHIKDASEKDGSELKQKLKNSKVSHKKDTSGKDSPGKGEDSVGLEDIETWKGPEEQYVVVFDAGSTGTRLHVFHFRCKNNAVDLVSEVFQKTTPGLSEYVNHPEDGASSLWPMIEAAMAKVPPSSHKSTPLLFKATAGFRLLGFADADNLLQKVTERLVTTDFSLSPGSIDVMSPKEEGLCGWITINYLLGKLDGNSVTATALDLGGASMQITYKPHKLDGFTDDLHQLELMGHTYSLYTHSYLGLGLMAVRSSMLRKQGDGTYTSDCLPVQYSGVFTFGGKDYEIRGPEKHSKDRCWTQVGEFLSSRKIIPPWDLLENEHNPYVYLFSYFFETMQWAGVIGDEKEKIMTVQDFYLAASKTCDSPDSKMPFLCQDLTYISRLLGEAFMLWDRPLQVVEEINSRETSWSLGAALQALSNMGV